MFFRFLFCVLFFNNIFSQSPSINVREEYSMYFIKDTNYVITKDSIYFQSSSGKWDSRKHNFQLETYDLDFIKNYKKKYLISKGLGKVYEILNDTIFSIDNSFLWKSRYGSFNFIRKNQIYSYGGYGFYDYKDNIIFLDSITKEWNQIYSLNDNKIKHTYSNGFYDNEDDILFIALGYRSILQDKKKMNSIEKTNEINTTILKFNFNSLKWEFSKLNKDLKDLWTRDMRVFNYKNASFINSNNFIEIDFKIKKIKKFKVHNTFVSNGQRIIYNDVSDKFFIAYEYNQDNKLKFESVNVRNIIGDDFIEYELFEKPLNFIIYTLPLIFASIFLLSKIFRNKNYLNELIENRNSIEEDLTKYESILLNKLIEIYPQNIIYPEISKLLELKLSYESNIKKIQKTISSLNFKLGKKLKLKGTIVQTTRNNQDKRIKQVRIYF